MKRTDLSSRRRHQGDGGGDVHYVSLCRGVIRRLIQADVSGNGASEAELANSLAT